MKKWLVLAILLSSFALSQAEETRVPAALIYHQYPGANVLLVDKRECSLNVYQFQRHWKLLKRFECTTGRRSGDKRREGDLKTPTGVYYFSNAWNSQDLYSMYGSMAKLYGAGAFELNYPNMIDRHFYRRNGSGIWLHGTEGTKPVATRGCISTSNNDFLRVAQYINLNETPVIIEESIQYTDEKSMVRTRMELLRFLSQWVKDWEGTDTGKYLAHYSKDFRTDYHTYRSWYRHKNHINGINEDRHIYISNISVFQSKGLFAVRFLQNYSSTEHNDVGLKHLWVQREADQSLRIISETWEPRPLAVHERPFQLVYKDSESEGDKTLTN